jgi:hypothetical protein
MLRHCCKCTQDIDKLQSVAKWVSKPSGGSWFKVRSTWTQLWELYSARKLTWRNKIGEENQSSFVISKVQEFWLNFLSTKSSMERNALVKHRIWQWSMSGGIPLHRGRHMKRQKNLTNMTGLNFGLPNLLGTRREGLGPSLHNIGVILQTHGSLPATWFTL